MSEIVERLHRLAGLGELIHVEDWKRICVALANGANHIEALEERNRKLEEVLEAAKGSMNFAKEVIDSYWEGECGDVEGLFVQELAVGCGLIRYRKPTAEELSGPDWWGHEYDIGPDTEGVGEFTDTFKAARAALSSREG